MGKLVIEQCKILRELEKHSEWMEIENKDLFERYTENKDFVIYNTLTKKHIRGKNMGAQKGVDKRIYWEKYWK